MLVLIKSALAPWVLWAQEAVATPSKGPSVWESLVIPMVGFFLVFYFLILRPQARKLKETQTFLGGLKKGDEVLTSGGILGTIVGVSEKFVDLKVAEGMKFKVLKSTLTAFDRAATASKKAEQK